MSVKPSIPPGPPKAKTVDVTTLHKFAQDHRKQYGQISHFGVAGRHLIFLNTPDAIREALNTDHVIDRVSGFGPWYILPNDISMQNFSSDWWKLKEVFTQGVRSAYPFSDQAKVALNDEYDELAKVMMANGDNEFDPWYLLKRSMTNCVVIGFVGHRYDYDHDIIKRFLQFDVNSNALYGNPKANFIMTKFPWLRHFSCGYGGSFKRTRDAIDRCSMQLLGDVRNKHDHETDKSLMCEMMRVKANGGDVTDANMTEVVFDAYIGGVLTMSAWVSSGVYQLMCHPDAQTKLQREIDEVIGTERPSVEHLAKMPYAEALYIELFRLTPCVPVGVPRSNRYECTLFGHMVPQDSIVMPNLWGVFHDEEYWEDPWTLRPERFMDDQGKLLPPDHPTRCNIVMPSEDGKRACPAMDLGQSYVLLSLVNIFQRFNVIGTGTAKSEWPKGDPREYVRNIILYTPEYNIKVQERNVQSAS